MEPPFQAPEPQSVPRKRLRRILPLARSYHYILRSDERVDHNSWWYALVLSPSESAA
jgi:hypothetical protein